MTSQTVNNKENSKKQSEIGANSKVALKPREFGREITNATASSQGGSGMSGPSTKL